MLDKNNFKDFITITLVIGLFILAAYILWPIIGAIIWGIILGYIFYPVFIWINKKVNNKTWSAFIVCFFVLIVIIAIISFILGSFLSQLFDVYFAFQKIDIAGVVRNMIPEFVSSSEGYASIAGSINSALSVWFASLLGSSGDLLLKLPSIFIQLFVVLFIFFFSLKDGSEAIDYFKSLNLFKKETQEKFFFQFKEITNSVIWGHLIVGVVQGLAAGISYFVLGVPNALFLTFLTVIAGIIPVVGPWLVWIPVDIYLFAIGRTTAGFILLIYGLVLVNWIDNILRPLIVSRRTKMNTAIILIGMFGGLFSFGVLGLILGPLILAYVLLAIEIYRKKPTNDNIIFIKEEPKNNKKDSLLNPFK